MPPYGRLTERYQQQMNFSWKKSMLSSLFLSLSVLLPGCGEFMELQVGNSISEQPSFPAAGGVGQYEITANDRDTSEDNALIIDFNCLDEGTGTSYTYDGETLLISKAGTYVLKGSLSSSQLRIDVFEDEIVHLVLDNAEIAPANGAAIYVENAGKVILTSKEGTENILSDGFPSRKAEKACIFSNSDLTVNGSGVLCVYGYHFDGVRSKDQVKIIDTVLYAKAKGDGIRGNDGVIITDSFTEIECEGTGLYSDSQKDIVAVQGGSCKIIAGKNAVSASQYVSVKDCQTDFYSIWEPVACSGIQELDEDVLK